MAYGSTQKTGADIMWERRQEQERKRAQAAAASQEQIEADERMGDSSYVGSDARYDELRKNQGSGMNNNSGGYVAPSLPDFNSILERYKEQAARQEEIANQERERKIKAAAEARARLIEVATNARDKRTQADTAGRDAILGTLQSSYNNGIGNLNTTADKSLQQSYLSSELAKRNIGQELAASGRSGGAAESTMLGINNSYGNARGDVETQRVAGLGEMEQQFLGAKASNEKEYQNALSNNESLYQNAISGTETNYQNSIMGTETDYSSRLTSAREALASQQAQVLMQQVQAAQQAAAAQNSYNKKVAGDTVKENERIAKENEEANKKRIAAIDNAQQAAYKNAIGSDGRVNATLYRASLADMYKYGEIDEEAYKYLIR